MAGGHGEYPSYASNYTALNYSETVRYSTLYCIAPRLVILTCFGIQLRLEYDETRLSYKQVMDTYWKFAPDPTYPQDDPAYSLRIFVNTAEQREVAEASVHQKQLLLNTTIYAEILNASDFEFWKVINCITLKTIVCFPQPLQLVKYPCGPGRGSPPAI